MKKQGKTSDANLLLLMAIFGVIFLIIGITLLFIAFTEEFGVFYFDFERFTYGLMMGAIGVALIIPLGKNRKRLR